MNDLSKFAVLIVPGLGGSGPEHWHTFWEAAFPQFQRLQQADWDKPDYADWAARLTAAVEKSARPVVLVAHSLGTTLTMRWSLENPDHAKKVAGAFLVAPSDRDRFANDPDSPVQGWGNMILKKLPFPTMVLASRDDDRVSFERAQIFANAWGATFVDAGSHGHLGSAAQLGVWPFGLVAFGQFIATLRA